LRTIEVIRDHLGLEKARLARNSDLARAMDLAESISSPNARIQAFVMLASAIPDRQAKK
jgi:hypothetical protein